MDDEARTPSGLDPAHRRGPRSRPPWGRRWPARHPRQEGGGSRDDPRPAYAALDLGTNNCRLLVARATRDSFRVVDAFSRIIRFDLVGLDSTAAMMRLLADAALALGEPLRLRMQVRSFEADLVVADGERPLRAVFIRAPWLEEAGPEVEVLAEVDGHPVLAREGRFLVAAFHPELTGDSRLHALFLESVREVEVVGA